MINIFLIGATGRMGQALQDVARQSKSIKIIGGIGRKNAGPLFQKQFPNKTPRANVVIDFSSTDIFVKTLEWCVKHKMALVSGVTGISEEQEKLLKLAAKKIPILWAPNMSVGVAIVKKILMEINIPSDFDVHLLEYHHRHKKDAPSGTAKDLANILKKKTKKWTGTSSIRGGGIFGVHRIDLMAESEVVSIEHQALDRQVFAKGAITAAEWLVQQKSGLYSMQDVLK